jgi:hypothetical protein
LRLDPHSLPVRFEAHDQRADGGIRTIEMSRERVVVRREVRGISMVLKLNVAEYAGVALRAAGDIDSVVITLEHRDPSLSVPLMMSARSDEIAVAWQMWATALSLPRLIRDGARYQRAIGADATGPAPRRRRRNAICRRRPRVLMRRKPGAGIDGMSVHAGEREIIART